VQIIANNITTRNPKVARVFRREMSSCENSGPEAYTDLQDLAQDCDRAGADVLEIDLQQHFDRPDMMQFAVKAVQQITDKQLCLSSNNAAALEAGIKLCKRSPILNYVAMDVKRLQEILPLAVKYNTELVLLLSDPSQPSDARQMMERAAVLVGSAEGEGISHERVIVDPGIFHITTQMGQNHLVEVMELMRALPETFDPPVRTTCWLANSSAGAPARLRPLIETTLLARLSGVGLSSVFLDVLRKDYRRVVRLLKIFDNQEIYADGLLDV
jgi:5-methyltetrahydrofolate corrinoid/iron sulfur protein methyltransferase